MRHSVLVTCVSAVVHMTVTQRSLWRVSITRKAFPRKPLYKQLLETGHLVSAQMAGGGVTGQRVRSTVTTPRPARSQLEKQAVYCLIPSVDGV